MEYNNEQWTKILTNISEIDDHAAIFFVGSINEEHTGIEFNFISRLENDEETIDVVKALANFVEQAKGPTDVVSPIRKPDLKVIKD